VLAVWRAVVNAGAYADVATAIAGELASELTPARADELVRTLEKLDEAVGSALVVVRAELRDQLNPAQLQIPLQSEVG
jgi:energy-converting hydrogenase Eha subunit E